jgi:hypothetical protein
MWLLPQRLYVTRIRSWTVQHSPSLSWDRQGWKALVFVTRLRFLQLVCRHHLRQTPGLSSVLLGGACTYAKPRTHAQRLRLLGRPVFGLVGVQFGWEGSPTTFGSVTTSYLVHGKKAIH